MSFVKSLIFRIAITALLALGLAACSGGAGSSEPTGPGDTAEPKPTDTSVTTVPALRPTPPLPRVPASRLRGATAGTLPVDSVDIMIARSKPVQVTVAVQGNLPDSCTKRQSVTQTRNGNAFVITITTTRPAGAMCTQVLTPFQESISLDTMGLNAGSYTVIVNGISTSFEMPGD